MLDLILGKSDSLSMKEKMAFALESSNPVDDRVEALDDFEMVSAAAFAARLARGRHERARS